MSENTPVPPTPPPQPGADAVQKKQTVRISLPPKPAGGPSIRIPTAAPAAPAASAPAAAPSAPAAPAAPATVAKAAAPAAPAAKPTAPAPAPAARPAPRPASGGSKVSGLDVGLAFASALLGIAAVAVQYWFVAQQ